jgi:haloalkane dehalogenase
VGITCRVYKPRRPRESPLFRLVEQHVEQEEVLEPVPHRQVVVTMPRLTDVLDSRMTHIDIGEGDPVVFLHGNGTFSYLWRNIIPYVQKSRRCLAPDLIGMGDSGRNPSGSYRFVDHYRYIEGWFETLNLKRNVILVLHDWGGALGFNWAYLHPQSVQGIVYMETFVYPLSWDVFPRVNWFFSKAWRMIPV